MCLRSGLQTCSRGRSREEEGKKKEGAISGNKNIVGKILIKNSMGGVDINMGGVKIRTLNK